MKLLTNLDLGAQARISDMLDPVADQDAATKAYVDAAVAEQSGTLHLYISPSGSDSNDGSLGAPVLTWGRVWELKPRHSLFPVVVHAASGSYTYALPPAGDTYAPGADISIWGDGAGVVGDTGFVLVEAGVAQAGTTSLQVVLASSPANNAYKGMTLQLTSGAATGYRRLVNENTGSTCLLSALVESQSAALTVAPGDGYQILRPGVSLSLPADTTFARQVASASDTMTALAPPGVNVNLANVELSAAAANTWLSQSGRHLFFGVRIASTNLTLLLEDGLTLAGVCDVAQSVRVTNAFFSAIGHTHVSGDWLGWGVSYASPGSGSSVNYSLRSHYSSAATGKFDGWLVGERVGLDGGVCVLRGGALTGIVARYYSTITCRVRGLRTTTVAPSPLLITSDNTTQIVDFSLGAVWVIESGAGTESVLVCKVVGTSASAVTGLFVHSGGRMVGFPQMSVSLPNAVGGVAMWVRGGTASFLSSIFDSLSAPSGTALIVDSSGLMNSRGIRVCSGATGAVVARGGTLSILAGKAGNFSGTTGCALQVDGGEVSLDGSSHTLTSAGSDGTLVCSGGGRVIQQSTAGGLTVSNSASGSAIRARSGGVVALRGGADTTLSSTAGYLANARLGGRITFDAAPSGTGTTMDLTVGSGVGEDAANTALGASESGIARASNGSVIARAA